MFVPEPFMAPSKPLKEGFFDTNVSTWVLSPKATIPISSFPGSKNCPEIKGFNRRGLYRMKQFYETYKDNEFVSTLLTQISWSNHLAILSSTKSMEEREFYIKLCILKNPIEG
jgi:hypothetical protein